ncbi:MAG: peptidase [Rhodocyclaceae bacterium]|nr:peptidase [Rhodocyclaceae bacterium]
MKKTLIASALLLAPFAANAHDAVSACATAIAKSHPGKIVKLEVKTEDKATVYEFDVQKADGSMWDIECLADSGKITEVEQEVAATDAKWTAKVKVSEADAKATALKAFPGTVVETEYEIEPNGALSYEFDIKGADGKEYKVEVDAVTGKIVESSVESVQAGEG